MKHIAQDMLLVLSELSEYIDNVEEFLEMIVEILSIRNLHEDTSSNE
jgi:hypothetical protein